jgi:hypothetical protein
MQNQEKPGKSGVVFAKQCGCFSLGKQALTGSFDSGDKYPFVFEPAAF